MTLADYDRLCAALPGTSRVVQWGGASVWKVGGKVFAIARDDDGAALVTFKCSEMAFGLLGERPGLRPAPYLASRGLTWIQRVSDADMDDAALADYLAESHRLVALKLTRAARRAAGLPTL